MRKFLFTCALGLFSSFAVAQDHDQPFHRDHDRDRDDYRRGRVMCVAVQGYRYYGQRYVGFGYDRYSASRDALRKCFRHDDSGWGDWGRGRDGHLDDPSFDHDDYRDRDRHRDRDYGNCRIVRCERVGHGRGDGGGVIGW